MSEKTKGVNVYEIINDTSEYYVKYIAYSPLFLINKLTSMDVWVDWESS